MDDWFRATFRGVLNALAGFFNRIGLHPNTMTIMGLVGSISGSVLLGFGHLTIGGFIILISGIFDALDGSMARLREEPTRLGAFIDSVTDRYSDLSIFAGLLAWFIQKQDWLTCGIIYIAAIGTVMVSYVKARAESLGYTAKMGMLSRVERYLVIVPGLVFNIPRVSIWIIAIFANYTALQRIWHVRNQALGLIPSEPDTSIQKLK
ncbi:MAG: CDP-alcohol phosphatidyltransferase family protein [Anaerolineaceae bacterium]|nr:CDP-alcohol phosphatidyltransferase family protein [Anaerolineaceae bacterium]